MDVVIPDCYQPLSGVSHLRSGEVRYCDLSSHIFTLEEKIFIAKELCGTTQVLAPTKILASGEVKVTCRGLAERYLIAKSKLHDWRVLHEQGKLIYAGQGRPTAIDAIGKENIENRIIKGNITTESLLVSEITNVILSEKTATSQRRNKRVHADADVSISPAYVSKFRKTLNIKARIAQDLPPARVQALRDIRMAYRIACMMDAFSGHLPATHKWNADATTIIINEDKVGAPVCCIPSKEEKKKLDSSSVPSALGLLVKWVAMVSAAGESSPLVLVITIKEVPEGEFFAHEVKGLTGSTEIGSAGWLYFCSSRAENPAMWKHWFEFVVIPTFQKCREYHVARDENGDDLRMFFSTDGEAVVMNEVFDALILTELQRLAVDMAKGGPGTTSVWQPCDVADTFRDVKVGVKMVTRDSKLIPNDTLRHYLDMMFSELTKRYPSIDITSLYKGKIIHACETVVQVMRAKYMTPEKITEGFIRCGQHVRTAAPSQSTVSYQRIMGGSLADNITQPELDHMLNMRPK